MPEPSPAPDAALDASTLLLIVVGSDLPSELHDRPFAYSLRDRVHTWVQRQRPWLNVALRPVVCADVWYVNAQALHHRPTISLGRPTHNALSAFFAKRLDDAWTDGGQITIQLDPEFVDLRAGVWGSDAARTAQAIDLFVQNYLDAYLRAAVTQVEPSED